MSLSVICWSKVPTPNKEAALLVRYTIPKIIMAFGGSYLLWYHMKYNQNTWMRDGGWVVYEGKPQYFGKGEPLPSKEPSDYFERGFKSRKALLYKPSEC